MKKRNWCFFELYSWRKARESTWTTNRSGQSILRKSAPNVIKEGLCTEAGSTLLATGAERDSCCKDLIKEGVEGGEEEMAGSGGWLSLCSVDMGISAKGQGWWWMRKPGVLHSSWFTKWAKLAWSWTKLRRYPERKARYKLNGNGTASLGAAVAAFPDSSRRRYKIFQGMADQITEPQRTAECLCFLYYWSYITHKYIRHSYRNNFICTSHEMKISEFIVATEIMLLVP